MNTLKHFVYDYLIGIGLSEQTSQYLNMLILLIGLMLVVFIVDFIIRKLLIGTFSQFASRSKTNFDDLLISNKVPKNIAHIIPLLIAIEFVPDVFSDFYSFETIIEKGLKVFAIILTLWVARSLLNTLKDLYELSIKFVCAKRHVLNAQIMINEIVVFFMSDFM